MLIETLFVWFGVPVQISRKPVNIDSFQAERPRYLECLYPSVHCGLTASRMRSRAHLLKSGRMITGLNAGGGNAFLLTHKKAKERQMGLTCWYRAVPVVMVDFVRMLPALGPKVKRT